MRRRLLLAAPSMLLPAAVRAGPSAGASNRKYAVLSLVGDRFSVVVHEPQTGALDANRIQVMPLDNSFFDDAALAAAESAIANFDPGAPVAMMRATTAAMYERQEELFSGPRLDLPADLAEAVHAQQVTRLVVLARYRGEAGLRERSGHIGAGKLEGLGYYIDAQQHMRRGDTGEKGVGLLAPFVCVKARLFDLDTGTLLKEVFITASATLASGGGNAGMTLWKSLTAAQKFERLGALLGREVARAMPELLQVQGPDR